MARSTPASLERPPEITDGTVVVAAEAEQRAYFDLAGVATVQIDAVTRQFRRVNHRFAELVGYAEDELLGLCFLELTLPEERTENLQLFAELVQGTRRGLTIEKRLRRKDGSLVWVNVTAAMTRDPAGRALHTIAIVQDISERKKTEAELRRSEQRFAAIFSGAAAGLAEISLDGKFARVNEELCRMLGRPAEELVGVNVLEAIHPDDAVRTLRAIGRLLETSERVSIDKRYVRSDGRLVWANSIFTRLDDENGEPRGLLSVTIDLTARREAERAQQESETKFRTLAEASPAFIWQIDSDGGLVYVNERYLEFFGRPEAELLAVGWQAFVHPDDAEDFSVELVSALFGHRPLFKRARIRRHDGVWRWIESQALPHFGDDGRYLGHVGHSSDITELLDATEALRRSEERLRRATEIETVGIVFFSTSGRITQTNSAFLHMTGYSQQEVESGLMHIDTLTPPEYRACTRQALLQLASLGRAVPYEKESIRKDGSRWWGLFAATRLSDDEAVEFVIDVTERKRGEEELHGYREELENRVLHRTAELDAVNGSLRDEILERKRVEHARHELLRRLVSAQEEERRRISRELHDQVGQDLTALMIGLKALEAARGAALPREELQRLQSLTESIGKQIHDLALQIRPTALDDLGLIRTLSNYVEEWAQRSGLTVDFHATGFEQRLPAPIETAIYRIAREALNNVLKHAHATQVSLIIERHADHTVAIIEDDGCGFDPERLPAGAEMRLGIVGMRERATLVGGELSIESSPGSGTTVFVRLPTPAPAEQLHG